MGGFVECMVNGASHQRAQAFRRHESQEASKPMAKKEGLVKDVQGAQHSRDDRRDMGGTQHLLVEFR